MEEEEEFNSVNVIGTILGFGLISVFVLFFTILFFASLNNYGIGTLYDLTNNLISANTLPASFSTTLDVIVSDIPSILQVLDYLWLGCFITMIAGTLFYSYNIPRKNYFNIFTMSILGLIIFLWLSSYVAQVSDWFVVEIYNAVLPTISNYTPIFNWYLNNLNIINLILVSVNIIVNFVDLDFSRYYKRKGDGDIEEI